MNLFLVFALILLQPTEGVLKSNKGEIELLSHRSSLFLDRIMVPMSHLRWYANALKTLLRRFEESTRERICTKKNGSNCCIGDVAKNIVKGTRFVNNLPRKNIISAKYRADFSKSKKKKRFDLMDKHRTRSIFMWSLSDRTFLIWQLFSFNIMGVFWRILTS